MTSSRNISEVEAKLRMSLASPLMVDALEATLPLIRKQYTELRTIAMMTESEDAQREADRWLTAVLLSEHAYKEAKPPLELRRGYGAADLRVIK